MVVDDCCVLDDCCLDPKAPIIKVVDDVFVAFRSRGLLIQAWVNVVVLVVSKEKSRIKNEEYIPCSAMIITLSGKFRAAAVCFTMALFFVCVWFGLVDCSACIYRSIAARGQVRIRLKKDLLVVYSVLFFTVLLLVSSYCTTTDPPYYSVTS